MKLSQRVRALAMMLSVVVLGVLAAPMAHATVTVNLLPGTTPYMFASGVLNFAAITTGDGGAGVTWSLSSGGSTGTLSGQTITTATYTAPSTVTTAYTVTLKATSIANGSVVASATITLEPAFTKTAVAGLTAMGNDHWTTAGGYPNNNMNEITTHHGVYAGAVMNILWSQLEPTSGVYDFSAIDGVLSPLTGVNYGASGTNGLQGLAEIIAYNSTYTPAVAAKIRLRVDGPPPATNQYPGTPSFVMSYGGTTGGVSFNPNGSSVMQNQIGAYWAQDTQTALTTLQTALAAYYDANPLMHEITVATCASLDGEPYIEATDSVSVPILAAQTDGSSYGAYNDANRTECFEAAGTPYLPWKATVIDSDYNRFETTDRCRTSGFTKTCGTPDATVAEAAMANLKTQFGSRGSLANHDLPSGSYPVTGGLATFYPTIASYGAPIEFQTVVGLTGLTACQAAEIGIQYNMTEMEIHQTAEAQNGGSGSASTCLSTAQLGQLSTIIAARNYSYNCSTMPTYDGTCSH